MKVTGDYIRQFIRADPNFADLLAFSINDASEARIALYAAGFKQTKLSEQVAACLEAGKACVAPR